MSLLVQFNSSPTSLHSLSLSLTGIVQVSILWQHLKQHSNKKAYRSSFHLLLVLRILHKCSRIWFYLSVSQSVRWVCVCVYHYETEINRKQMFFVLSQLVYDMAFFCFSFNNYRIYFSHIHSIAFHSANSTRCTNYLNSEIPNRKQHYWLLRMEFNQNLLQTIFIMRSWVYSKVDKECCLLNVINLFSVPLKINATKTSAK